MSWLDATLTMPGIAGMVLTVGMAIDCSVLIYEKIKETLKEGVTFKRAVDIGFSDAMVVILDGNITTFIVGLVLYKFGTGPVQGFAITMMLGVLATLISGLFVLKSLFTFILDGLKFERISI
jgi:preprotein translocase subunit SecD